MNKKIVIGCIAIAFMLVAITMVSAVSNEKTIRKKETPLFFIRTSNAVNNQRKEMNTVAYVGKGDFLTALPGLKDRLYHMFGIELSQDTQNIIKEQLKNDPLLVNKIMNNDNDVINSIIQLICDSDEGDIDVNMNQLPRPTEGPECPPTYGSCTSEFKHCDCLFAIYLLLFFTFFLTIFLLPFLILDGTLTTK